MENQKIFGRNENLVLNERTFKKFSGTTIEDKMTVRGAVIKTAILLILVAASAALTWILVDHDAGIAGNFPWLYLALAALAIGIYTATNPDLARYTAPIYAVLEGAVLGVISATAEAYIHGVVLQAVLLTFGTLFSLLVIYTVSGFKVNRRFLVGLFSGLLAILGVYIVSIILQMFGVEGIPLLHENGVVGIIFNLFVVFIAALNLVMDFDIIERGAEEGAPLYMEWYTAYGLMVSLIWLYLEILELLIRIYASSDDNSGS